MEKYDNQLPATQHEPVLTARQRKCVEVFCDCLNATKEVKATNYSHANAQIIGYQDLIKHLKIFSTK